MRVEAGMAGAVMSYGLGEVGMEERRLRERAEPMSDFDPLRTLGWTDFGKAPYM